MPPLSGVHASAAMALAPFIPRACVLPHRPLSIGATAVVGLRPMLAIGAWAIVYHAR